MVYGIAYSEWQVNDEMTGIREKYGGRRHDRHMVGAPETEIWNVYLV